MFEELLDRIRTGMTTRADADALAPILRIAERYASNAALTAWTDYAEALCNASASQDCEHGFTVSCPEGCN